MASSNDMPAAKGAFIARVVGLVHGVGFRYTTQRKAERLGLTGWVRNGSDGSVEVFAQGDRVALDRLGAFLEQGPRAARVQGVLTTPAEPDPALLPGFHVRF